MAKIICIIGMLAFGILSPTSSFAESGCNTKKEHISLILQKATGRLRIRLEEVDRLVFLSEQTRGDFHQHAEWLIAWMRDQVGQMNRRECSELSSLVATIRVQLVPVQIRSQAVRATTLMWYLDLYTQKAGGEVPDIFLEARAMLVSVQTEKELPASRMLLRRAAFLTKQGLRQMQNSAIIE